MRIAPFVALVALASCKHRPEGDLTLDIWVNSRTPSLLGAKLIFQGREIAAVDEEGHTTFDVPRDIPKLGTFALRVPTPCGPVDRPLVPGIGGHVEIQDWDRDYEKSAEVWLEDPETAPQASGLYYDNRAGTAGALVIGKLTFPIAADSHGVVPVWQPLCEQPPHITWNGRPLDVVTTPTPDDQCGPSPRVPIVSLSGPHCYVVRAIPYLWAALSPPPATTTRVADHDVYFVSAVDYWLQPAPDSLRTQYASAECKRDILDCDAL